MLHKQTVVQATILISLINFLGKFVGFAREMLIAKYFGATGIMDAYVIGLQVPTLVLGLFAGGIGTLIIPMYISRKQKDPQDAKRYVNQILVVWGAIFIVVSALIAVFASQLVRVVAYGFKGERFDLAVKITQLLAPFGFINIVNAYFSSLLQAEKQFIITAISGVLLNTLAVFFILLFCKDYGIFSLVFIAYFTSIISLLINLFLLIYKYHLISFLFSSIHWNEIYEFFKHLLPLLLSAGLGTINSIVDRSIASDLSSGSIAALQYSQKIWSLPISLFVGSIAVAIYPTFSELASDKNRLFEYKQSIHKTIIMLMYILVPSTAFLILYSLPITRLFYERGVFDPTASILTSFVSQMYSLGILFVALYPILMKVFYSFKNTTTPLLIAGVAVALNVIGNIVLSRFLFAGGIALATSLTHAGAFFVAYMLLGNYFKTKEIIAIESRSNLFLEFVLQILATLPMLAIGLLMFPWASISSSFIFQAMKLTFIALILGAVYYFSSALLKTKGQKIAILYLNKSLIKLKIKGKNE